MMDQLLHGVCVSLCLQEKLLRDKVRMSVTSMSTCITAFHKHAGLKTTPSRSVSRTSSMFDGELSYFISSGTSVYGHLTSMVTPSLLSPLLSSE